MNDFEVINKLLKKGTNAARGDQQAFNKYSKGIITFEECKTCFFNNNGIYRREERELITDELLKEWIYSPGYGRRK